jgi:two-component system, NarL family, nitrate/nitrite response regulator NarL
MPDARSIRIGIADDHPIFREGLRRLLEAESDFVVVAEAGDGEEAIALVQRSAPDILLLDLAMPRMTGLDALRELSRGTHPVRTILLTASISKAEIVLALQLGAVGVLLKDAATQLLYKCIRSVMAGQFWIGRESVTDLVNTLREAARSAESQPPRAGLTRRELDIIREVAEGATNKDIASRYGLSEQTVKNHLSNIFDKLGVSTRLELALYAVNHRLLDNAIPPRG